MPFSPEQLREHRALLRERGLCTRCHKNKTDKYTTCDKCREETNNRKKRIRGNICHWCEKKLDRDGTYCTECLPKANMVTRKRRRRLHEQGLCAQCEVPVDGGHYLCVNCSQESTERKALSRSLNC